MRLAVMQPYLFPYIGYFQLINLVDKLVIYDDVQYIRRGWINRNRILMNGKPYFFTLPLRKGARSLNINQRVFTPSFELDKRRLLRQIENAYRRAPYFSAVFSLIEKCFFDTELNVSSFIVNSLEECCRYLDIDTPFFLSSQLRKQDKLTGPERIIDINKVMGADHYVNSIGGKDLYDRREFTRSGLKLSFIRTRKIEYAQFGSDHVPCLSIIDVMMFNKPSQITALLLEYDLE